MRRTLQSLIMRQSGELENNLGQQGFGGNGQLWGAVW
jgi:hypothetical protein